MAAHLTYTEAVYLLGLSICGPVQETAIKHCGERCKSCYSVPARCGSVTVWVVVVNWRNPDWRPDVFIFDADPIKNNNLTQAELSELSYFSILCCRDVSYKQELESLVDKDWLEMQIITKLFR